MFDYLDKYGNKSWDERSMTNEDLAVFSQIIYTQFENLELDRYQGYTLGDMNHMFFQDGKPFGTWDWAKNVLRLWTTLPQYSRFASATLDNFYSNFQPELEEQFAAATFGLGNTAVIVFRGTDMSVVGWKEDFDMGYMAPLPCHHEALKYINTELPKYEKVYVVGQSKGGHLAVYASACADDQSRIVKVLSLEGPGIDKKTYDAHWSKIKDKVEILLPQNAIIGMTVGYGGNFTVVKSTAFGLLQHDPFTWIIDDDHFRTDKLSHMSIHLYTTLHDFVEGTSNEDRGVFIRAFFRMADSLGADDVETLGKALLTNVKAPISVLMKLDDEEKEVLKKLRSKIISDTKESFKLMVDMNLYKTGQKIEEGKDKLKEKVLAEKDKLID